jgi:hypothetical protein
MIRSLDKEIVMYYGHTQPTSKQLGYAAKLANDLGVGGTARSLLMWANGWSASKASAKMSKETISSAISDALSKLKAA